MIMTDKARFLAIKPLIRGSLMNELMNGLMIIFLKVY